LSKGEQEEGWSDGDQYTRPKPVARQHCIYRVTGALTAVGLVAPF
jgi:hypothetical protein